jgi:hypothetical protein
MFETTQRDVTNYPLPCKLTTSIAHDLSTYASMKTNRVVAHQGASGWDVLLVDHILRSIN